LNLVNYVVAGVKHILCTDEMRMRLLAKSCVVHGFDTLLSNLIATFSLEEEEDAENWKEYLEGCGQVIVLNKETIIMR
jgi:hypothetical protein